MANRVEVEEKITRATFLYLNPRKPKAKFAQCETCIHFIPGRELCEIHSLTDHIDDDDSCGFYLPGEPKKGIEPQGIVRAEESGLVSRQVRCENCAFFDPHTEPREHCDLYTQLNRMLPNVFDLDRYVEAEACCNAQTPGKRAPEVFGPLGPLQEPAGMGGKENPSKREMLKPPHPPKRGVR